jgi:sarcosine oxidase subunit gamma
LLVKLSATEALLLSNPAATATGGLLDGTAIPAGQLCFHVPRRDGSLWFRVTGERAPAFFAKLCGVDLRHHRFPDGEVAQTSLARMSGIIIRDDCGPVPAYHIVADSASAAYLWRVLQDAAAEFDGGAVGLAALLTLGES